uniref:NBS-LRR resistance protein RGH2 n=1 Tax=Populus alba TaxID=43335 RepID=A0A4V6A8X3_POPAL|nr:NBS-LRR resistance protein RGH2 [Populus alba]
MAEGVLFSIAEEIINTLGSLTAQEVALWWGLKDQLRKLNDTVTSIKAVIQDAEEQAQKKNHQIEDWLMKLREAVYDAEDLLDDFSTQVLRKQLMAGKRVSREVRLFFSRSNQFVYGLRMGHRVEALRERLDGIEIDSKKFNFDVRGEETASLTTIREQTTSSEPEITVGRESEKKTVRTFLMNSNYEHNVSVISVVGMGGLGKTTLAQHVFNDEQVKAQFGVRLWVSVSGSFDVRKIIKGAVDESWELFRRKAFPQGQESGHVDERIRKEIVGRCCGVPLVIKAIASDFGMKEVSPLIEKIKHLRYLHLWNNEMEALSNSVISLVNLQVLKLNSCRKLKELPRDIGKLINLRHLDVGCYLDGDLCEDLEYMPRGIGKLTSLQTLSCFVVAKKSSSKFEMIGGLDELSRLNELRGRLEIIVKGYEGGSCLSEFEGAKLMDKQYLQSLIVRWDPELDSDLDIDLYDKMLQSLQPNSNLQELRVEGYGGMRFPSWVSDLTNLVRIRLEGCRRLKHIPPLDGIPYLEELSISELNDLEYIDSEGVGGKGVSTFFPSLKRLVIKNCGRLKGWWKRWSRDEMNDDSDESTIEEGLIMLSFPRLSSLFILMCPNLTSMPLFPTLDEDLYLYKTSSMPLQQTMKMPSPVSSSSFIRPLSKLKRLDMSSIDDMESLPEVGLQNLSSLQRLWIWGCSRLKSLPLPDQGMPSLQQLDIRDCRELKSLSESESQGMIPYLPSLQFLRIDYCSEELSGRARGRGKEREEWPPNIKHIPDIVIDNYYIQKEGRYVKGERNTCTCMKGH